jgi:F-box interacting protein
MFGFGYHPRTGQYKVAHIPCRRRSDNFVLVFTLGHDKSWREMPVPNLCESYKYKSNKIISVDGSTYWLTNTTRKHIIFIGEINFHWFLKKPTKQYYFLAAKLS